MQQVKTVDEYIRNAPPEVRPKLEQIRNIIKSVAPQAEEKISYAMPYYGYKGRLAYFAYFKNHIGLYALPPVIKGLESDLKQYRTATATIRFPLDQELPVKLIEKLVKAGVSNNESRHQTAPDKAKSKKG